MLRDVAARGTKQSGHGAVTAGAIARALACGVTLMLGGCWMAPTANVQPRGEPRLIQDGIAVESVQRHAIVRSVDPATRTIVLVRAGAAPSVYRVGPRVSNFGRLRPGEHVRVRVAEQLAVYVLRDGRLPGAGGALESIAANAKVLSVDPTYRLMTLQYPTGENETFKVGLDVALTQMEAGDDVVVRPLEIVAVRVRKR
jgi:hypothetical protein